MSKIYVIGMGPVNGEDDMQMKQSYVLHDLVKPPLEEGRVQRRHRHHALAGMETRLARVQEKLDSLYAQMETAKAELGKPFPQEQELKEKSARLAQLNIELNLRSNEYYVKKQTLGSNLTSPA